MRKRNEEEMPVKGQMKEGRDENREVFIRWKEENDKGKGERVVEQRVEKWKENDDKDRKRYGGIMTRKEEGKGGCVCVCVYRYK